MAEAIRHGDVAYVSLWTPDADRAAAFYAAVLGWKYAAGSGPRGYQVEAANPHHGLGSRPGRPTLFLAYAVDSLDAAVEQVRALGGTAEPPQDRGYGHIADSVDNQDTPFALYKPADPSTPRPAPNGARPGDVAYVSLSVGDSTAAKDFYGSLLGWQFTPGRMPDGWQVQNVSPEIGLGGGAQDPGAAAMYRVDDAEAAADRVRTAGGTAGEVERLPYGLSATCADDQGTRFYLGQL
jgi:predicted enzyme related to lactoylglutathione lyase